MKHKENNKSGVTVQDIADAVNISASTVSRALNNHPKISKKTKEKVWDAARKLGYQPNIPIYMNQKSSKAICFIVPDISTPYYQEAIQSAQKIAQKNNYHLFIASTYNEIKTEEAFVQSLISQKIEGVIVALFCIDNELSHLESLLNFNIPTVFINKNIHNVAATTIIPDVFNGAYKAAKHLISMNCKNIHIFTDKIDIPLNKELIEAFYTALDKDYDTEHNSLHSEILNQKQAYSVLNELNVHKQLPDGIISTNPKISNCIIIKLMVDLFDISFTNDQASLQF